MAREALVWSLVLSSMISTPVLSAQTDISTSPITSTNAAQVKPNIMLLMDTSGSMGWGHMPDEVETQVGISAIGYKAAQCNVLYYNRNQTYAIPKKADGTQFPTPSFTAARYDAFDTASSTVVDLSTAFKAYDNLTLRTSGYNDTAQPAYYYYKTGGTVPITGYSSTPCLDGDAGMTMASSDGGTWNRVVVGAGSGVGGTDERGNFAVWYTYYRTRLHLVKSAASLAFTPLTDSFRVGFITVRPKDNRTDAAINPAKYLAINDFNTTQRGLWFDKLFAQKPGGSSPAREGLARVGRHYAGMQDGINTGMTGDPVQYSCQQNFTIMTTDGYWNGQEESSGLAGGHLGGPVDISGKALVGQRDGVLDAFSTNNPSPLPAVDVNVTPRPIWDGTFDGLRTITSKNTHHEYQPCGAYYNVTTAQINRSTHQVLANTSQTTRSTVQNLQSTIQHRESTTQLLKSTSQLTRSQIQNLASTNQNRQSTLQNLRSTTQTTETQVQNRQATIQYRQSTVQILQSTNQTNRTETIPQQTVWIPRQSTTQNLQSTSQAVRSTSQQNEQTVQMRQSTVQNLASTTQTRRSTSQTTEMTVQNVQSTTQNLRSTSQVTQSTSQAAQSTSQNTFSTSQIVASTSQLQVTTSQVRKSTSQLRSCDASTELCTPTAVGTCTPGGNITCETISTGPTLVASCSNDPASSGNNWTATTCATTGTGPTPTASCTSAAAAPGNTFTTTSCSTATTGPTPVASCSAAPASFGNNYTATTCATVVGGPTPIGTCSPQAANSGNSYTTTTCATNTTGPTGVASCSAQTASSGNSWTTTTCGTVTTTNVPVASCTAAGPSSGNNYTTITCGSSTTTNVPVASCTVSGPTSGNNWTTTTCSSNNTSNVPVASCSPAAATSSNSFTATTCGTNNTQVGSGTCVPSAGTSVNSWTTTTCPTVTTGPTAVDPATCTAATAGAGNNWTTTTCPVTSTGPTPVASCLAAVAASGNNWTATTCGTNNTTNVPVASCTPATANSTNSYTTTTCSPLSSALTPVGSCTPVAASSGNSYTATTCPIVTSGPTPVSSCSGSAAASGNSWTTTTCGTNVTTNVPVASCSGSAAASGNNWTTTTCSTNNTTNAAVASCTPSTANSGNGWTTTTCPAETLVSGPTAVSSCTPSPATSGNGYQRTDCNTVVTVTPVQSGTCTGQTGNAGNGWVTITCNTTMTANVPVQSCSPQTAAAGNGWVQIVCGNNNTTNAPAASCTASAATSGNNWTTTTCPAPVTTGPTPVASCTPVAANAGNSYIATTCPAPITTGPTGVNNCTNVAAAPGNSYTATVCGTNNTSNVPVATCNNQSANGGNSWTQTSCSTNSTTNVPVASCTPESAIAANNYTAVTCPPPVVTTNVPVQTCLAEAAVPGNSYTSRTCSVNASLNVPTGTCVADPAQSSNSWTETTCPLILTSAVGVLTCTTQAPSSSNSWTDIACTPNNTSNVPVSSCSPASPTSANGYTTVTCSTNNTMNVPVASCSGGAASAGNSWTQTICTTNNTTNVPVSSCTPIAATSGNGWTTTTCPVLTTAGGAPTCTASGPTSGNNWTTITCPAPVSTGPTPVASCSSAGASAGNAWTTTTCSTVNTSATQIAACNDPFTAASSTNNWTATTCTMVAGKQRVSTTSTRVREYFVSGATVSLKSDATTTDAPVVDAVCHDPGLEPALPADGPPAWTGADTASYPTCGAWPCTVDDNTGTPRSVNSLADVAQYYYVTDLRTAANEPRGVNYYRDDVFVGTGTGAEDDRVRWQHMTTFSIALGVSGTLQYRSDYKSAATGDFADIRTGAKNWPLWPNPAPGYYTDPTNYNDPRSIDDFWHAAVNGRGLFFSASNPTAVIAGLSGALGGVLDRLASGSTAGASNLEPVAGDNFVYLASYTTQAWTGDVQSHEIDVTTGAIQAPIIWSAQALLDAATSGACDNRNIKLFRQGATDNLVNFSWNSKRCDLTGAPTGTADTGLNATEQAHFNVTNVGNFSQYPSMTDGVSGPDQRSAAVGANLVNFLRGQRGLEDFTSADLNKLYRRRDHVLGDIVNGSPVYVRAPFASFSDAGYAAFKSSNSGRAPMLYVPGNDGMLHAFYAGTSAVDPQGGKEAWAVVPSSVLPKLYKLADNNYKNLHEYFVDATPTVADAYVGSAWKTMLVGGLNGGGRGFYALDVTDPAAPKGMWEFKWSNTCYDSANASTFGADCHIGLSFGRPIITKLADGRWVVMVTSGYNNVNTTPKTGDGKGYLYVLDAATGEILYKIATPAGDSTTPSGLAQINNYVEKADVDNTTVRVYGTDLLGNIWRFDVNDNTAPSGREATLVGTAKDSSGNPQPITVRAELSRLGDLPMVFVATGRLLGATDVSDVQTQSIYGIVDPVIGTTAFPNLRTSLAPLAMTQSGSGIGATRTIACTGTSAQCGSTDGWRVDLPDSGERVNVGMKLHAGTLVIGSNVPQISACLSGGYSWINYLNWKSGLALTSSPGAAVSQHVSNSLIVGLTVITVGGTNGIPKIVMTMSDGSTPMVNKPEDPQAGTAKRTSWREVLAQ